MKTRMQRTHPMGWRTTGMIVSAMLFALSITELMLRAGTDAPMWRGMALTSLYLVLCLSQRRLFAPARTHSHWRGRG